ncbi:hypothetical protein L1987_28316 [Smallanthus sonchifolius]|uniref:Uncharacterized protein n=1 Tax=Smallanthus sonchifolius TaxID=185202 RepID=A0ACB9IBR0_9ASTR|nr:hypothetical protein L1987_28316 [Smallanthus sonchifolius]
MKQVRLEAKLVMFGALDSLFTKTRVRPEEISILIMNCNLFNPTLSLSSMIVNHYKLRPEIMSFNLGGMGCSAGLISIDLAQHLLKANPNSYGWSRHASVQLLHTYPCNERSMLLCNCIFRMGGAAMLLSNKSRDRRRSKYELAHTVRTHKGADDKCYNCIYQRDDDKGIVGVSLARELMAIVGDALKTNITTLGGGLGGVGIGFDLPPNDNLSLSLYLEFNTMKIEPLDEDVILPSCFKPHKSCASNIID